MTSTQGLVLGQPASAIKCWQRQTEQTCQGTRVHVTEKIEFEALDAKRDHPESLTEVVIREPLNAKKVYQLSFSENHHQLEVLAVQTTKLREECIAAPHYNERIIDSGKFLSMNQTFYPPLMYLLERMTNPPSPFLITPASPPHVPSAADSPVSSQGAPSSPLLTLPTPHVDAYSIGVIRHYDSAKQNSDAKEHMKIVLKDAFSKQPLPNRIVGYLLTNNDHWQLVIIDLQNGIDHPDLYVINTTNMTLKYSLEEIQQEYFWKFGDTLNQALHEVGSTARMSFNDVKYMQGLQYGNMGCGITTTLNANALIDLPTTDLESRVFKTTDIVRKIIQTEITIEGGKHFLRHHPSSIEKKALTVQQDIISLMKRCNDSGYLGKSMQGIS